MTELEEKVKERIKESEVKKMNTINNLTDEQIRRMKMIMFVNSWNMAMDNFYRLHLDIIGARHLIRGTIAFLKNPPKGFKYSIAIPKNS